MEINMQRWPAAMPIPAEDDAGAGQAERPGNAPAATAGALPAVQKSLLNAARQLADAQGARCQAHAEAARAFSGIFGGPENGARTAAPSAGGLALLRDALAGAALSEQLDRPREEVAGRVFRGLQSGAAASDSDRSGKLGDIWKELAQMIGKSEQGDLTDYAAALDKYTALYQSIVDILSKLEKWVRADGDNNMRIDFGDLANALKKLLKAPTQDQVIAGKTPGGGMKKEAADAICKKLGLNPDVCSYRNRDGTYCVIPDFSQLRKMLADLPQPIENSRKISIAAYNAWKAGFDSQISRVEDALQTRGQKYSNVYSRFENFHKTITSIIQSMADMLRQFLQF
jgi:type III secretion system IpaD/SipD/SspD family effector